MLGRTILAAISCVSLAAAQLGQGSSVLTFTRVPNPVTAGQAQAITYATNDTVTPVSIILRKGSSGDLQTIATLTTSANGGSYIWTPKTELENGSDYALQITQGTQTNYYGPFSLQGGGMKASSSSSASGSSTSNQPGMPTGFPAFGAGSNSSSSARNMTMTGAMNSTSTSMSSGTTTRTSSPTTMAPSSSAPAATSARPSGSSAEMIQVGSGFAMVFGAFAALLL